MVKDMFNETEFNNIFYSHKDRLYKYCYIRLNKDKQATEEVLDDVFDLLFKKWDGLEKGESIGAYLYRVADIFIKKKLSEISEYYSHNEEFDLEYAEKTGLSGIHIDKYFESEEPEVEECIEIIKQSLDESEKQLFNYRYVENKTLNEIVEITRIPYSSLRYRLFKLDQVIKKEIKNIFK